MKKCCSTISVICCAGIAFSAQSLFLPVPLKVTVTTVQPMTGIVLWTDNDRNATDAIALEFSYMLYNQVVKEKDLYNWSAVDALLDDVASRRHQAILRFRFVYPGFATAVPEYIKQLAAYSETEGKTEGLVTWFPDWTNAELQRFTLEFYRKFAERYDHDPRLAFLQTGFGLWAEYHIYDGPFELGKTFPGKTFQADFIRHLDTVFTLTPWSISIDAADDTYSPFKQQTALQSINFGLFDDSFMNEDHAGYNTDCWKFFGRTRFMHSPAGGEFSYYTDYDQEHALDISGLYGVTWEKASADFHISYMIGNDQPEYQSMERIKAAGMAGGYRFQITRFDASADSSVVTVKNTGVAPIYYDAYVTVGGVRARESLRLLGPDSSLTCRIPSGGTAPVLTIESDRLVPGQSIGYEADLEGASAVDRQVRRIGTQLGSTRRMELFSPDGRLLVRLTKSSFDAPETAMMLRSRGISARSGIFVYRCTTGSGGVTTGKFFRPAVYP